MPKKKVDLEYIQVGDGPEADQEEIHRKLGLFLRIIQSFDPKELRLETIVALTIAKRMCEDKFGRVVDVQIQQETGDNTEEIKARLKERYERTGSIEKPFIVSPADPSVH